MSEPITSSAPRPAASGRSCRLSLIIDTGRVCKSYRVRPVALPDAVAAFRLLSNEGADYLVCLKPDGSCSCECFAALRGECKHVGALRAAGLLPVALVELLSQGRQLLAAAEAELAALKAPKRRGRPRKAALAS